MDITESDWKIYSVKIAEWQERHMSKLLQDYMMIIAGAGEASLRFWNLEKRINKDVNHPGVIVQRKRSNAVIVIIQLLIDGVISAEDLTDFSEELQDHVIRASNSFN